MPGRPRDPAVDEAILKATFDLVESQGYRGLSIEGIAARSGVTKQTIYRRYRNKGEVILDVLVRFADQYLPKPGAGPLREDLLALLRPTFHAQQGAAGQLNRALAVEALQDERFAELLWTRLINARRSVVREIFERARQRGEVTNPNTDFLIDLVYGPMWYRLLFGAETLDDAYAGQLVDTVLAAAVRSASATPVEREKHGLEQAN